MAEVTQNPSGDPNKRSSYLLLYTLLANGTLRILLSYQPFISYFFGDESKAKRDRRGRRGQKLWCAGKWCIPGGAIESGETCRRAAAREFHEETGINLDLLHLPDSAYTQNSFEQFDAVFTQVSEEQFLGVYNGIMNCINQRAQVALRLDQQNGDNDALARLRIQYPNCPWGDECENINILDIPDDAALRDRLLQEIFNDPGSQNWFIEIIRYLSEHHDKPKTKMNDDSIKERHVKMKKNNKPANDDEIFVYPVITDGNERFLYFKGTITYYWEANDEYQRFVYKNGVIDDWCAQGDDFPISDYTPVQRNAKSIGEGIKRALDAFTKCKLPDYETIDMKNDIIPITHTESDCAVIVKLDQTHFDKLYDDLLSQMKYFVTARRKIMAGSITDYDDLMDQFPNLPTTDCTANFYYIDTKDDSYNGWINRMEKSQLYDLYAQAIIKYFRPPT